jgi:hypothetical protein
MIPPFSSTSDVHAHFTSTRNNVIGRSTVCEVLTTSAFILRDKKVNDERIQSQEIHAANSTCQKIDRQLHSPHLHHHRLPFAIQEAIDLCWARR